MSAPDEQAGDESYIYAEGHELKVFMRRKSSRSWSCVMQALEPRTLLSTTPASVLTKAIRQDLLNHWSGSNKAYLQTKLDNNQMGAFDGNLLSYMQARAGQ